MISDITDHNPACSCGLCRTDRIMPWERVTMLVTVVAGILLALTIGAL